MSDYIRKAEVIELLENLDIGYNHEMLRIACNTFRRKAIKAVKGITPSDVVERGKADDAETTEEET